MSKLILLFYFRINKILDINFLYKMNNENKKKMKNLIFITRLLIVNLLKYECNEKVLIIEKKVKSNNTR